MRRILSCALDDWLADRPRNQSEQMHTSAQRCGVSVSVEYLACLLIFEKHCIAPIAGILVGEVAAACRSDTENNMR